MIKYDIIDVVIDETYKEGDIDLQWVAKGIGFGHLAFIQEKDGSISCNNECMSKDFIKAVLNKLVDKAKLNE